MVGGCLDFQFCLYSPLSVQTERRLSMLKGTPMHARVRRHGTSTVIGEPGIGESEIGETGCPCLELGRCAVCVCV